MPTRLLLKVVFAQVLVHAVHITSNLMQLASFSMLIVPAKKARS